MTDDWTSDPPRRDPWVEYAIEKLNELLIAQEIEQEDRNGRFTMTCILGLVFVASSWWHAATQPTSNQWDFLGLVVGAVAIVAGITLRINGQLDLQRLRRTQKLLQSGKYRL